MPGFCQFFHDFQTKFHGRSNDLPHVPINDSAEQKKVVDIGRVEMTIAVANRAAMAAVFCVRTAIPETGRSQRLQGSRRGGGADLADIQERSQWSLSTRAALYARSWSEMA